MADGLAAGRGPPYAVRMKTLLLFLVTALAELDLESLIVAEPDLEERVLDMYEANGAA